MAPHPSPRTSTPRRLQVYDSYTFSLKGLPLESQSITTTTYTTLTNITESDNRVVSPAAMPCTHSPGWIILH